MARNTEERIKELKCLRAASAVDAEVNLRKALRDKSNFVVAEAAKITAELHIAGMVPDLLGAFGRLFEDPVKSDSKCLGKTAIMKALTVSSRCHTHPDGTGLGRPGRCGNPSQSFGGIGARSVYGSVST
jgi:hypothetical protein